MSIELLKRVVSGVRPFITSEFDRSVFYRSLLNESPAFTTAEDLRGLDDALDIVLDDMNEQVASLEESM